MPLQNIIIEYYINEYDIYFMARVFKSHILLFIALEKYKIL